MPSRFAEYDTDQDKLPQGMTRIGYDADSETYTFSSADGSIWEGSPGSRYGNLTRVGLPVRRPSEAQSIKTETRTHDPEEAPAAPDIEASPGGRRRSASRVLLRCVSKVTSSLRPRSDSQASSTAASSPDTLSPDVQDFLFSHVRGKQDQSIPEK